MTINTRREVYLSQGDVTAALIEYIGKYDPDILRSGLSSVVVDVNEEKTTVSWNKVLNPIADDDAVRQSAEEILLEEMQARERGPFQIDDPAKSVAGPNEGAKVE